jgi:CRISPR-associated endonuclease/helicase Cas3
MRSLIQLSGRIQRHRQQQPKMENLYILSKNYRGLCDLSGKNVAFHKPGFESQDRKLNKHDLADILNEEQYQKPNSIPSIEFIAQINKNQQGEYVNFVEMEQRAYFQRLLGQDTKNCARLWWQHQPTWCAELQRQQPFRKSESDEPYCLYLDEDNNKPVWKIKNENVKPVEYEITEKIRTLKSLEIATGCQFWLNLDTLAIYLELETKFEEPLWLISKKYGEARLRKYKSDWFYHAQLGVFNEL